MWFHDATAFLYPEWLFLGREVELRTFLPLKVEQGFHVLVLILAAEAEIRVFLGHGGPVEIFSPGQHVLCDVEFPTLSPQFLPPLLQSPPVPGGAELWPPALILPSWGGSWEHQRYPAWLQS